MGVERVQDFDDTYWLGYDAKVGRSSLLGLQTVQWFPGYQYNLQEYNVKEVNSSDSNSGRKDGSIRNDDGGTSDLHALYSQLAWEFFPQWTATTGLRVERWNARNGQDGDFEQPSRTEYDFSPKFSLDYAPKDSWLIRGSVARAVRYPVVSELFVGDPDVRSTVVNNPSLSPESVIATQLFAEYQLSDGFVRVAVFRNEEDNTIFNQRALLEDGESITTFVNIDEVVTQGVELSLQQNGLFGSHFDALCNVSFNDAEIEKNSVNPEFEGNEIPRVPEWRINALGVYHLTEAWDVSLGMRYADSAFNNLSNEDTNQETYEGISSFFVVDAKTSYAIEGGPTLSFAVDNLNDEEYYMFHPFPQRTFLFDLTWRL